jgi:peptidoglycan/LPS O-acetylase OafA/YrhL
VLPIIFIFVISLAFLELCVGHFNFREPIKLKTLMEVSGAISYSVYLIHWPMLSFCRYILIYTHKINLNFYSIIFSSVFFLILILISLVVYYYFELPCKEKFKKYLRDFSNA